MVARRLQEWTQEGFVGIHDAYYVSVDNGQRVFGEFEDGDWEFGWEIDGVVGGGAVLSEPR